MACIVELVLRSGGVHDLFGGQHGWSHTDRGYDFTYT